MEWWWDDDVMRRLMRTGNGIKSREYYKKTTSLSFLHTCSYYLFVT